MIFIKSNIAKKDDKKKRIGPFIDGANKVSDVALGFLRSGNSGSNLKVPFPML